MRRTSAMLVGAVCLSISACTQESASLGCSRRVSPTTWQTSDPQQEESIRSILDRYVSTGNVYGFE